MKIDYGKIIETAERRRNTLQELGSKLEHAKAMEQKLLEVSDWVCDLQNLYGELDQEGRALLPPNVNCACSQLSNTRYDLLAATNIRTVASNSLPRGVTWLEEEDDDPHI